MGQTEALLARTSQELVAADWGVLGPGGAWNVGTLLARADRKADAEVLWKREFARGERPWREAAGRDLFALYAARRDWALAEGVAERLNDLIPGPDSSRRLVEALYFQKKDDQARSLMAGWKPGWFSLEEERENVLFRGVLAARAGAQPEASAALNTVVFDQPASELHFRLQSFFAEDEGRWTLLAPGGREALAFQVMVYRGVPQEIVAWFKGRTFPAGFWSHRALIEGLETVFRAETRAEVGMRLLEGVRGDLRGEALYAWELARGRLQRTLGWWSGARSSFARAQASATSVEDRHKAAWNWVNSWVQVDPTGALPALVQTLHATHAPSEFSDVVEDWTGEVVQERRWDLLVAAWRDLGARLPVEDRTTLGFLLARLAAHGLVDLKKEGILATADELLEQVIVAQPVSYEAVVARAVLGRGLEWSGAEAPFVVPEADRDQYKLWTSQIAFGLGASVASQLLSRAEPVDPAFIDRSVEFLQAHGQFRPSLQMLARLLRDPGRTLTRDRAARLYPLAYRELVVAEAEAGNVEPSLVFGLVRQESLFDPEARSWVGAQGLTQLMPTTAAEMAGRLKMKTFDLSRPADNLKIGVRYLATLVKAQGRITWALMAYNAGTGRIRPWKADLGRLPEEIAVEAIPLAETRTYVKRVLVGTVMTGVLHFEKPLGDMVALIYPGFKR